RRFQELGIPVDEIDSETGVVQWQVRCVQCGNTSDETLADHSSELDRQRVRSSTPLAELQPGELALPRSNPPATRPKKPALPPKRRDYSRYFDAVKLTPTQRDYLSLKFEHEMSVTAIARLRNKHHSSVQETLERAQTKLQSNLDPRLVSDSIRRA